MKDNYAKFGAMVAVSTLVMFGLMYLNTYALEHIFFSETRAYMALVMGATMTIIMPMTDDPGRAPRPPRPVGRRWGSGVDLLIGLGVKEHDCCARA